MTLRQRLFARMRQTLQTRGLIDGEFRLTAAGHAYCERLLKLWRGYENKRRR